MKNVQEQTLLLDGATNLDEVVELTDLQLAVVGGGSGEVVFH